MRIHLLIWSFGVQIPPGLYSIIRIYFRGSVLGPHRSKVLLVSILAPICTVHQETEKKFDVEYSLYFERDFVLRSMHSKFQFPYHYSFFKKALTRVNQFPFAMK